MDLPCPEWIKHVEQKWTQLESGTRERFSVFTDIDDLFHFGQSQLQPEDLEALSRISEKYPVKKSSECAARFREQGNVSFKEKDYTSAALYYTQGVCHAEKNTEHLSLCYANRSAALFHLGLYTKCLEDIQQAFAEGYPSHLQCKLMDREKRCTSLVKIQESMKASHSKHQTPQSNKNMGSNTNVSSAVSVHFTPEKGRHLLATENKSAGEMVIEDEAFSFVLIPANTQYKKSGKASVFTTEPRHCHHCLSLKQRLSLEVPPCHDQEEGSVCWGSEKSLLGATALRHMLQLQCNAQAVTAIKVQEDTCLPVQSSKEVRIATALFPILSLLNHSCQPNTSISFSLGLSFSGSCSPVYFASGVTVKVRACRDIAAGQELLHCYGPHCSRMDVEKRQRLLLKQYFFHCQCDACKLELAERRTLPLTFNGLKCEKCGSFLKVSVDVHVCSQLSCDHHISNTELQRRMQILQHHLEQSLELMENNQINGALSILQKAVNLADSILMKTHPLQGKLADAMARAYATMGLWRQAASHLKSSIAAVCLQYGKDSVELGRQQFKLAQLHFNGGDGSSALSVIPLARRLISLHCDPHCKELQELQAMEACLI
ncbi:SET and MYND domain-containing protein 4 isoform X5 [Ictalurus furcatus]|uniref:SET and MYND domain-containing protein 4 isoform X5 n=1 Tax=Ictalurus furcatus TaxID=66913 RepID=UPI0023501906|nr:SET and MYND domain-containing protein 4 isoform X5 [Ictalurus furcatus]